MHFQMLEFSRLGLILVLLLLQHAHQPQLLLVLFSIRIVITAAAQSGDCSMHSPRLHGRLDACDFVARYNKCRSQVACSLKLGSQRVLGMSPRFGELSASLKGRGEELGGSIALPESSDLDPAEGLATFVSSPSGSIAMGLPNP